MQEPASLCKPCPRFYIGKSLTSVLSYADLLEAYYSLHHLQPVPCLPHSPHFLKGLIQRLEQTLGSEEVAKYGDSQGRYYDLEDEFVEVEEVERGGEGEFRRAMQEMHRVERLVAEEYGLGLYSTNGKSLDCLYGVFSYRNAI